MQVLEATGKSVEEATQAAAKKLGVDPSSLSVTVLETTKGLFGKSTVRIRATVESAAPAPAETPAPEAPVAKDEKPARRGRGKAKDEPTPEPAAEAAPEPEAAPVAEAVPAKKGRGRGKSAEPESAPAEAEEESNGDATVATEADAEVLAGVLRGIVEAGELEVEVSTSLTGGRYVNLIVNGKDAAHLIGKQGEVLNSLQYLVNIISGRRVTPGVRATLDANDYRTRREQVLRDLATKIATAVQERQEEAVLDALPAFERRIVHKAVSEMEGVTTYSEGEEPNRRVVIAPKE